MPQPHAHSQPIETYGLAPHNRNIWPHNSRATAAPSRLADSFVCAGDSGLPTTYSAHKAKSQESAYSQALDLSLLVNIIPKKWHVSEVKQTIESKNVLSVFYYFFIKTRFLMFYF